jgi:hypothetical protein
MNKINPLVKVKHSQRLFENQFRYKAVVVCPGGHWFRGKNLDYAQEMLDDWSNGGLQKNQWLKIKSEADYQYCLSLLKILKKATDFHLRIEHPLLSFYSNDYSVVIAIANLDVTKTKYVAEPPININITQGEIILKRIDYDFKVTIGATRQNFANFVQWSENSKKVKMTKGCKKELRKDRSWGGSYFYVKDEPTLLLVRMFIGSEMARIDKVIKATK